MQLKSSVDIKQRTESRVCVSVNVNKVLPYLDVKGRNLHVRGEIFCSRFSWDDIQKARFIAGTERREEGRKREILLINTRSFAYAILKKVETKKMVFD